VSEGVLLVADKAAAGGVRQGAHTYYGAQGTVRDLFHSASKALSELGANGLPAVAATGAGVGGDSVLHPQSGAHEGNWIAIREPAGLLDLSRPGTGGTEAADPLSGAQHPPSSPSHGSGRRRGSAIAQSHATRVLSSVGRAHPSALPFATQTLAQTAGLSARMIDRATEGVVLVAAFKALDWDADGVVRLGDTARAMQAAGIPWGASADTLERAILDVVRSGGPGLDYYSFTRVVKGDESGMMRRLATTLHRLLEEGKLFVPLPEDHHAVHKIESYASTEQNRGLQQKAAAYKEIEEETRRAEQARQTEQAQAERAQLQQEADARMVAQVLADSPPRRQKEHPPDFHPKYVINTAVEDGPGGGPVSDGLGLWPETNPDREMSRENSAYERDRSKQRESARRKAAHATDDSTDYDAKRDDSPQKAQRREGELAVDGDAAPARSGEESAVDDKEKRHKKHHRRHKHHRHHKHRRRHRDEAGEDGTRVDLSAPLSLPLDPPNRRVPGLERETAAWAAARAQAMSHSATHKDRAHDTPTALSSDNLGGKVLLPLLPLSSPSSRPMSSASARVLPGGSQRPASRARLQALTHQPHQTPDKTLALLQRLPSTDRVTLEALSPEAFTERNEKQRAIQESERAWRQKRAAHNISKIFQQSFRRRVRTAFNEWLLFIMESKLAVAIPRLASFSADAEGVVSEEGPRDPVANAADAGASSPTKLHETMALVKLVAEISAAEAAQHESVQEAEGCDTATPSLFPTKNEALREIFKTRRALAIAVEQRAEAEVVDEETTKLANAMVKQWQREMSERVCMTAEDLLSMRAIKYAQKQAEAEAAAAAEREQERLEEEEKEKQRLLALEQAAKASEQATIISAVRGKSLAATSSEANTGTMSNPLELRSAADSTPFVIVTGTGTGDRWVQCFDQSSGYYYYYCAARQESAWALPEAPPLTRNDCTMMAIDVTALRTDADLGKTVAAEVQAGLASITFSAAGLPLLVCIECEARVPSRKCFTCDGDLFCTTCFNLIHAKGRKQTHEFGILRHPLGVTADENSPSLLRPAEQAQQVETNNARLQALQTASQRQNPQAAQVASVHQQASQPAKVAATAVAAAQERSGPLGATFVAAKATTTSINRTVRFVPEEKMGTFAAYTTEPISNQVTRTHTHTVVDASMPHYNAVIATAQSKRQMSLANTVPTGGMSALRREGAAAAQEKEVWHSFFDRNFRLPYYYNPATGNTTWDLPENATIIPMNPVGAVQARVTIAKSTAEMNRAGHVSFAGTHMSPAQLALNKSRTGGGGMQTLGKSLYL
jgi:hypothetical protein